MIKCHYPVQNGQLYSHFIRVRPTEMNGLGSVNEHHQMQQFNPVCITTLGKKKGFLTASDMNEFC